MATSYTLHQKTNLRGPDISYRAILDEGFSAKGELPIQFLVHLLQLLRGEASGGVMVVVVVVVVSVHLIRGQGHGGEGRLYRILEKKVFMY